MSKIIRVGIAGFGRSGYGIHARCLKEKTDKFKIVAVADELEERRKDAVEEFGAEVYTNYQEMLDKALVPMGDKHLSRTVTSCVRNGGGWLKDGDRHVRIAYYDLTLKA